MKILLISHFYPPTHTAGAENYTRGIALELRRRGHDVQVICAGSWDTGRNHWNGFAEDIHEGIRVVRAALNWTRAADPNRALYRNLETARFLARQLEEMRPDIVHLTSAYTLSASVISAVKDRELPLVVTLVDFWFLCPSLHLLRHDRTLCDGHTTPWTCLRCLLGDQPAYRWPARLFGEGLSQTLLTRISRTPFLSRLRGFRGMALDMTDRKAYLKAQLERADRVLAPTRFLAEAHRSLIPEAAIRHHPYGHDLSWVKGVRTTPSGGRLRLAYLGQVSRIKGVDILIRAFRRLTQYPVSLDIWGELGVESDYAGEIRALADGCPHLRLRGPFGRERLAEVLSQADTVVVPSIWYENNPLVIQEAFAAGLPVVASKLPGISELVDHGVNGLLFERNQVGDLAAQLRRLAMETGLLEELAAAVPPVKSTQDEAEELLDIYRNLRTTPCSGSSEKLRRICVS